MIGVNGSASQADNDRFAFTAGPISFYRILLVGVFGFMCLVGTPMLLSSLAIGAGPPPWFAIVWIAILGWNVYWWIFRVTFALKVEGDRLYWQGAFRAGSLPLTDISRLRPSGFGSAIEVIESTDGSTILVWTRRGFGSFCQALQSRRPDLQVRLGWQARLADAWPRWWPTGGSGFSRS